MNEELKEKTPEAKAVHQEFLKRCAKDLELLEKCRLTDEEIMQAHEGEKCRDCGKSIAETQLAKAIPLISAEAREQALKEVAQHQREIYENGYHWSVTETQWFDQARKEGGKEAE